MGGVFLLQVYANQTMIDVIRLILRQGDEDLCLFDAKDQMLGRIDNRLLLDLFAAGLPSLCNVQSLPVLAPSPAAPDNRPDTCEASVRWFVSVFDSLHDGVLIADENEIVRYINKSFERISGARFADVVGQVLTQARPGAKLGEVIRSGKPMLGVRRTFGDTEYMTDMHPLIINGHCRGGVTIARDITEIQQLQTKLSKYRARYNDLLRQTKKESAVYTFEDIIGLSPSMTAAKRLAEKLARSTLPVLLRGESGTGKELFAHAIHLASDRHHQAFITVNCAAIPSQLLESELFGYAEGAFSGARQGGKPGLVTLARHGTLFLDEIGEMNIDLQAKILRMLQTGEVQPVGSLSKEKIDVRIIAATNANLEKMIELGKFRTDLYYRLNVSQIHVPPLHERREDIALLADRFLAACSHHTFGRLQLAPETLSILERYSWPGNVRELENTIKFIANIAEGQTITPEYLPQVFFSPKNGNVQTAPQRPESQTPPTTLQASKFAAEKLAILTALDQYGRSVPGKRAAARQLGISLTTLYSRLKYFQIE